MSNRKKGFLIICVLILCALSAGTALANDAAPWSLIENENISITVKGYLYDALFGSTLLVRYENKTDDALMFSIEKACFNENNYDLISQPDSVEPHSAKDTEIKWYTHDEPAKKMDLFFWVWNMDKPDDPALVEQNFVIYPYGEESFEQYKLEHAPEPNDKISDTQTADILSDAETALVDNEQIKITILPVSTKTDEIWEDYSRDIYLENKTESELLFLGVTSNINGFTYPAVVMLADLPAGQSITGNFKIPETDLAALGIDVAEATIRLLAFSGSSDNLTAFQDAYVNLIQRIVGINSDTPVIDQYCDIGIQFTADLNQIDPLYENEFTIQR